MSGIADQEALWHGSTIVVLGAFFLVAILLLVVTLAYDYLWRRNERRRNGVPGGLPGAEGRAMREGDLPWRRSSAESGTARARPRA